MGHFPKPSEGSWTEHYPGLGTEPVSYEDSISQEFYEHERDGVFMRSWLNLGRVEQLPRTGSYLTREFPAFQRSVILVKDGEGTVRAFHNICRHRGNKLVWDDYPNEETSGNCRQFACKYHAWRYNIDGSLAYVQQEEEFFDLSKEQMGLVPIHCEVWEGWIFINFADEPDQTLVEFLGPLAEGLAGYPYDKLTSTWTMRSEINSNWKLFVDGFVEFYHAPVLHQKQYSASEAAKLIGIGYEGLHYELHSPHSMVSSWGGQAPPKDPSMVKPIENILRSGLFGPWDKPGIVDELPPMVNPTRHKTWGMDSWVIFPNFMILIWEPEWVLTYHYWPTAPNKHVFEVTAYFAAAKTPVERLRQEFAVAVMKEYALQDSNTLEATQKMLETKVVDNFFLNDQEILCRHHHAAVRENVRAFEEGTPVSYPWNRATTGASA
jgi:phenylpropionate dioxygenase-like ring-hydroxylating dioxygenase large terminal subunit